MTVDEKALEAAYKAYRDTPGNHPVALREAILAYEAAKAAKAAPGKAVRGELPIWKEGWIASRLSAALDAYLAEYVYSPDEGADHEPTEFERILMEDMLNGALSAQDVTSILQDAAFAMLAASHAPPPDATAAGGVTVKMPDVEAVARAISKGRGLNPDCQNQGAARDGSVDGQWPEPRENFGRPYDTRWHYGWRNQVEAAREVVALYETALVPAAGGVDAVREAVVCDAVIDHTASEIAGLVGANDEAQAVQNAVKWALIFMRSVFMGHIAALASPAPSEISRS